MPRQLPPRTLREYLQKDLNLADIANNLWRISSPIHERQNRPNSNENGIVHVLKVENNVWRLLQTTTLLNKANNLEDFMPFELFFLSCAACCHDFDKALKSALPEGFEHGNSLFLCNVWANDLIIDHYIGYCIGQRRCSQWLLHIQFWQTLVPEFPS